MLQGFSLCTVGGSVAGFLLVEEGELRIFLLCKSECCRVSLKLEEVLRGFLLVGFRCRRECTGAGDQ